MVPGEDGRNETPTHEIAVAHLASRGTYGVPRIHAELRRLERCVNRKRFTLAMRGHGIREGRGGARPKAEGGGRHVRLGRQVRSGVVAHACVSAVAPGRSS
ncbi:IS3 family transposase [Streptomyces noursei]|uniref:IS3 family transposase n=1 Tax=Streptomyces noursei TaxID=1971 RepID=UPI00135210FF